MDRTAVDEASTPLEDLYRAQHVRMARVAYLLTGSREVAEEVAHEAFLVVHGQLDRLRATSSGATLRWPPSGSSART